VNDSKEKRKDYDKFCHDVAAHRPLSEGHYRNTLTTPASTNLGYSPSCWVVYAISSRYMQSIVKVTYGWIPTGVS
jgi:hypothetical protein